MRSAVQTGLPRVAAPIEWAVAGGDTLYTVHVPILADGTIYRTIFSTPYPNRSTVQAGLMVKDARIEIVVHAQLNKR